MSTLDYCLVASVAVLLLFALRYRYRAAHYRRRYLAEQRSTAQLHDAIFHLRRHLERCKSLTDGKDGTPI